MRSHILSNAWIVLAPYGAVQIVVLIKWDNYRGTTKKDENETMRFAVAVILMRYCNSIYYMANEHYDTAVFFVKEKEAINYILNDLIKDLLDNFDCYKNTYGKGHEKREEIDVSELKDKIILSHERYVKDLIMKNLDADLKAGLNDNFVECCDWQCYCLLSISKCKMFM